MQWRKFYGRTMGGAMARVRRELGADALIVESRMIEPDGAAARMNPGARYEICAVRDMQSKSATQESGAAGNAVFPSSSKSIALLEDLGLLRSQINQLLAGDVPGSDSSFGIHHSSLDLADYHDLIARGVDHRAMAPQFRGWLDWRLAPVPMRRYIAAQGGPAARMQGESLREWLWLAWREQQGLEESAECGVRSAESNPRFMALLGPTGSGKTTTLAKIASRLRQEGRQNIAIATLDACRFGAIEQWRRLGKLIGIEIQEIVTEADLTRCMESWAGLEWVGIDTPGGMSEESGPGRLYGSILARYPNIESSVVVPMTQQDPISRRHLERGRSFGARRLLFSKLDESDQTGSIFNLTMNQQLKIDGFATGTRVPEDWEGASAEGLWRRVLAPAGGMC